MARAFTSKVITANALLEGDAVWFTKTNEWSRSLAQAELITDEDHGNVRLREAKANQAIIAGVYMADSKAGSDGPEPVHFREIFRTRGPSNYVHGKQET